MWIYENDELNLTRFVLGKKGENPLFVFGINPSTAEPELLDNTLKSVERIAYRNGFDSWIMFNLYPQRATNPNDMHLTMQHDIHEKNIQEIVKYLSLHKNPVILAAWGTLILKRPYLKLALLDLLKNISNTGVIWKHIGNISKQGHPHHPLYLSNKEMIKNFDMEKYISML